jgi:hypothetical protein
MKEFIKIDPLEYCATPNLLYSIIKENKMFMPHYTKEFKFNKENYKSWKKVFFTFLNSTDVKITDIINNLHQQTNEFKTEYKNSKKNFKDSYKELISLEKPKFKNYVSFKKECKIWFGK